MRFIIVLCFVLATATSYESSDIFSIRLETCRGCSLNRLPEVKKFVYEDAPSYKDLEVKFISGVPPELVLIGHGDMELERIDMSHLTREECNELVQSKGLKTSKMLSKPEL